MVGAAGAMEMAAMDPVAREPPPWDGTKECLLGHPEGGTPHAAPAAATGQGSHLVLPWTGKASSWLFRELRNLNLKILDEKPDDIL